MKGIHSRSNIRKINRLTAILLILAMIMESVPISAIVIRVKGADSKQEIVSDNVKAAAQSQITTENYSDLISIPDAWREVSYPDSGNEIEIKRENRWIILNGQAVVLQMHGEKSALYLDENANGIVDVETDLLVAEDGDEVLGTGNRLANYIIYGGRNSTMDKDICITVNSGIVGDIYGCFQCRTGGDVKIQLNGGAVGSVYGVYAGTARKVEIASKIDTGDITGLSGGCIRDGLSVYLGQNATANKVIGVNASAIQSPNVNCCVSGDIMVKLLDNAGCDLLSAAEVGEGIELQVGGMVQTVVTSLRGVQTIHGVVAKSPSVVIGGSLIVETVYCNFNDMKLSENCRQITGDASLTVMCENDMSRDIYGTIDGIVTSNVYHNVSIHIQNDKNKHSLYAVSRGAAIYGNLDIFLQDAVINRMEGVSQSVIYGNIKQSQKRVTIFNDVYFIRKAQVEENITVDMEGSEYSGYLVPMEQCHITGDVDITGNDCAFFGMLSGTNVVEGSETITYKNSTMTGQSVDGLVSDTISGNLTITIDGWQNGSCLTPVKDAARIMGDSIITISNSEIVNVVSYGGTVLGNSTVTLKNCIAGGLRFSGMVRLCENLTIDEGYYGEIEKYNVVYGNNNISILGGTFDKSVQFGAGDISYTGNAGDIQMEIDEGVFRGNNTFIGNVNSPHNQVTIQVADTKDVVLGAGVTIGLKKDSDTQLAGGMQNSKGEVTFAGQYVCKEELHAKTVLILPDSTVLIKNALYASQSFVNDGKLYVNSGRINIPANSERGALYYPLALQCNENRCNPCGDGLEYLNIENEAGYYALVAENNRIVLNLQKGYIVGQVLFKRDNMEEFEQLKMDEAGGFCFSMEEVPAQLQIVVELKQLQGTEEVAIDEGEKVIDLLGHSVVLMSCEKGTGIYEDENQDGVADTTIPICEGDYQEYTVYGVRNAQYDKGVSITVLGGQIHHICGGQNACVRNPGACVISINMQAGKVDSITASEKSQLEGRIRLVQATNEKADVKLGTDEVSGSYVDNQGDITIAGDYPLEETIEGKTITLEKTGNQIVAQSCSLIASDSITVNGEITVMGLLQTKRLINQTGTIYHQGRIQAEEYMCSWDGTKTGCLFMQGGTLSHNDWQGVLYPIEFFDYNPGEIELTYTCNFYRNSIALDSEKGITYYGRSGYPQMCQYKILEGYELGGFFIDEVELTHDNIYFYWTMQGKAVHIKGISKPKQISVKENFNTPVLQVDKQYSIENPAISLSKWLTRVDDAKEGAVVYELAQGQELPEGLTMDASGNIYGTPVKEYPSGKTSKLEITGNNGTKVTYTFSIIVKKNVEEGVPIKDRINIGTGDVQLNGVSVVIWGDGNNNYIYADDDRDGVADTPDYVKVPQYYKSGYWYSYYGWYRQNAVGDIRITVENGSVGHVTGAYDSTIDGGIDIAIGKKGVCTEITGSSSSKVTKGYKITKRNTVTVGGSYTFAEETRLQEDTTLVVDKGAEVTIKKDIRLQISSKNIDSLNNKGMLVNEGILELAGGMENHNTITNAGVISISGRLLNEKQNIIENNGEISANHIVNNGIIYNWRTLEYDASIQNNSATSRIYTNESLLHLKVPASVSNTYYPMELYDCNEGGSSIFYENAVNLGSTDKPSYYGKAGEQVQIYCELNSRTNISLTATRITKENGESIAVSKLSEDKLTFIMPEEGITAAVCYESNGIQLSAYEARISEGRVGVTYVSDAPLYDMQSISILQDEGEGEVTYNVSTLKNNALPAGLELTKDGKLVGTPKLAVTNVSTFITVSGRNGTTARFLLKLSIQKGIPVITLKDEQKDYTGNAQTLGYRVDNVAVSYNHSLITMYYYKKETGELIEGEPVEPGEYLAVAKARADDNYEEAFSNTASLTINRVIEKLSPKISVVTEYEWTGQAVILNYRVIGENRELDKKDCRITYYSSDGNEILKVAPEHEGTYQVEIYYSGNDNYQPASKKAEIYIIKNLAEKNQRAVDEAEQRIAEIGNVSYDEECKMRIERAEMAYDALTPTQKEMVSKSALLNLQLAKELYQELEEEALREEHEYQNQQAAERVIDMIYAMPEPDGSAAIDIQLKSIWLAYEGLSEEQKQMVSKDWKYYEQQVNKQEEIKKQIEATTENQGTVEVPASSEAPASSEQPTSSEAPASSEQPTSSEAPASSEQPSSSEVPASSEQPTSSEVPAGSEQPSSSEVPANSEEPAGSEVPSSSEQPASSEAPASSEQSLNSEAPACSETSVSNVIPSDNRLLVNTEGASGNEATETSILPDEQETGYSYIRKKGVQYKVISENGNKGTVAVCGLYKKNKKKVVIPGVLRYKEKSYRVVRIAAKSFYRKKKLQRITIKSPYIKKIGKKAFGGLSAKIIIKVPKKQRKRYRKYIRKSGYKGTIV